MTVEGFTEEFENAEQVGQRILEIAQRTEFGTPQYQALSDYGELQSLYTRLGAEGKSTKETTGESATGIAEMRIALLEHEIYKSKSQFPGYETAYDNMGSEFDDLKRLTAIEEHAGFPEDDADGKLKGDEHYNSIFSRFQNAVSKKRQ